MATAPMATVFKNSLRVLVFIVLLAYIGFKGLHACEVPIAGHGAFNAGL